MQKNYRQMFEQELMKSQSEQDPQYQQLESQIMKPQAAANVAPTLGLVDHFTGSNFAAQAPKEESMKEKLSQLLQLKGQQQSQKLSGLGKLASMQGDAEARAQDQSYKKELMGLQMMNARAKMAKAQNGTARKLGGEDIKAVSNIDTILNQLPRLREAMAAGQTILPNFATRIPGVGDNDASMSHRMITDAISRLQSGGALSGNEEKIFGQMIGSFQDSPDISAKKLAELDAMFRSRRRNYVQGPSLDFQESGTPYQQSRSPSSGFEYSDDMSDDEVIAASRMKGYL